MNVLTRPLRKFALVFTAVICVSAMAQADRGVLVAKGIPGPDKDTWSVRNCTSAEPNKICIVTVEVTAGPLTDGAECTFVLSDVIAFDKDVKAIRWVMKNDGIIGRGRYLLRQDRTPGSARPHGVEVFDNGIVGYESFVDDASSDEKAAGKLVKTRFPGRFYQYNIYVDWVPKVGSRIKCHEHGPLIVNRG